jgi:hypothetical protein
VDIVARRKDQYLADRLRLCEVGFEDLHHYAIVSRPTRLPLDDAVDLKDQRRKFPRGWWPPTELKLVYFSTDSALGALNLVRGCYYRPLNSNFAVIDSFYVQKLTKKEVVLICFQFTIAKQHAPKGTALDKFMTEFASGLRVDGDPIQIAPQQGALLLRVGTTTTTTRTLDIHLAWVVRHPEFKAQELRGGAKEPPPSVAARRLWKHVHQYRCGVVNFDA